MTQIEFDKEMMRLNDEMYNETNELRNQLREIEQKNSEIKQQICELKGQSAELGRRYLVISHSIRDIKDKYNRAKHELYINRPPRNVE